MSKGDAMQPASAKKHAAPFKIVPIQGSSQTIAEARIALHSVMSDGDGHIKFTDTHTHTLAKE